MKDSNETAKGSSFMIVAAEDVSLVICIMFQFCLLFAFLRNMQEQN